MSRKRQWRPEYKCELHGMYILEKIHWCKEPYEKKCEGCLHNKGYKTPEDHEGDKQRRREYKRQLRKNKKIMNV